MLTPEQAAALVEIGALQRQYGDVVSRHAWGELSQVFAPDATVTLELHAGEPIVLSGPADVGAFIARAIERFDHFQFSVMNATARLDDEPAQARGRVYIWELRHDGEHGWTHAYGCYDDRYAVVDGRWVIAGRRYRSVARAGAVDEIFGVPPLPAD